MNEVIDHSTKLLSHVEVIKVEFSSFFDVDEHFKRIQRKINKCLLTQKNYLRVNEMMPDLFEIFYQDINLVIHKLFEDIEYQRALKKIKRSNQSFRKLIDSGLPILLDNYERILLGIQGGHFMGKNINRNDFDALKLYTWVSRRLFLETRKNITESTINWLIFGCSIIAAISGVIGLFYH